MVSISYIDHGLDSLQDLRPLLFCMQQLLGNISKIMSNIFRKISLDGIKMKKKKFCINILFVAML